MTWQVCYYRSISSEPNEISVLASNNMYTSCSAADLVLNSIFHTNNSVIFFDEIGEGNSALYCHTTNSNCCKRNSLGEWYYPDGTLVPINGERADFYRNRDDSGNVKLNRRNNAVTPKGVFYCITPNDRGVLTRMNVALYLPTGMLSMMQYIFDMAPDS